jgi:hypothetical protein
MLVDIHAKSNHSPDVSASADDVLSRASRAGLDAVAFCDTLASAHAMELVEAGRKHDIKVFVGVEIPTDRGILVGFTPEVDSFLLEEEWRQATELTTPAADYIIEMFNEAGGAVIAARPYDLEIPYNMGDLIFRLDQIHGVEVFNSRVGQLQFDFALEAAQFMGVSTAGGSDPKGNGDAVGSFATFFTSDLKTQAQFVEALRQAEYWAVAIGEHDSKRSSRSKSNRKSGRRSGGRKSGRRSGGRKSGRGRRRSGRGRRN